MSNHKIERTLYERHLEIRLNQVTTALDRMAEDAVKIQRCKYPGSEKWQMVGALIYDVWEARAMLGLNEVDGLKPV
jgi:hypothetical protein